MADIYQACATVLKPGRFLVCVTKDMRSGVKIALRNLSSETIALCEGVGLLYHQRVIGLLATSRNSEPRVAVPRRNCLISSRSWLLNSPAHHSRLTSEPGRKTHVVGLAWPELAEEDRWLIDTMEQQIRENTQNAEQLRARARRLSAQAELHSDVRGMREAALAHEQTVADDDRARLVGVDGRGARPQKPALRWCRALLDFAAVP